MNPYTKIAAAKLNAGNDLALMDGRMLALYRVNDSNDVHYPVWEMHPEGDELLVVADGSMSVELRDGEASGLTRLSPHAAFVVPAMTWHRLIVHEPSVLMVITPRHNTVHEA
ncbi:cupin domain-containing protein [Paraburkholderia sp. D15]|uniref:cupin domain-containing protein n=1 Tax=Paraburkholderia sp. D15 TaxID=2880218 RepID=UPI002478DBC1|nr:cupin domain-containing protein [Paraburkholderia sp. D15]WGS54142.1 cupin domain-containing protein [Paraburkholderia sp. D15]